jgi:magnesium transporter
LIKSIEFEVDSIDELVLILKESEQSDMLRRVGYCRKRVMGLLRLLVPKADVVKTLIKRGETKPDDATRPELSTEVSLFLGDVQGKETRVSSTEGDLYIRERRSHPDHAAIPQPLRKDLISIPQQLSGTNLH